MNFMDLYKAVRVSTDGLTATGQRPSFVCCLAHCIAEIHVVQNLFIGSVKEELKITTKMVLMKS